MGGKESRDPVTKYGLFKHYVGDDIVFQPVAAPDGSLMNPRYATCIFLHDHGQNPQAYIDTFFCKASNKLFGFDKLVNVVCVQAPIVMEENDKGRRCAWNNQGQDLLQSQGYAYVQQIIEREIQAMGGRADKLFVAGIGVGGHIAMLSGFYSQHIFGGVFCLDTAPPEMLVNAINSGEGAAIFPLYEAKKSMFICITQWKASLTDQQKNEAAQQAQVMRGKGFLRISLKELKKSMDRAICQVHNFSRVGSQYEVDRMNAFREARSGKYDKQAQARNAPAVAGTTQ